MMKEFELYEPMRVWLNQYLQDKYAQDEIITVDAHSERLDRVLRKYGIVYDVATGIDIQIDVLGIVKNSRGSFKLFFIEAKKTLQMDEDTCMVNLAKFFLEFTCDESCGKCTPCRIGNKRILEILTKITDGKATMEDLYKLEELCDYVKSNSLCGLGQTSPNPVLSTLRYFKDEYIEHIVNKRCPAGVCKNLTSYRITENCKGCSLCSLKCPVGAISGEKGVKFEIDQSKCIKCGQCYANCRFGAIVKE